MKLTVLTPEKEIFHGEVRSVGLPGVDGTFQILDRHAPIVAALGAGMVRLVTGDGEYSFWNARENSRQTSTGKGQDIQFSITEGFVEVLHNEVSLLVQGFQASET